MRLKSAFTLVELVIMIVILALLGGTVVALYRNHDNPRTSKSRKAVTPALNPESV